MAVTLIQGAVGAGEFRQGGAAPEVQSMDLPDWAVTAGELLIVGLATTTGEANPPANPYWSVSGGGLVWTRRAEARQGANFKSHTAIFTAVATATTTITDMTGIPNSDNLQVCYSFAKATGFDVKSPIGATAMLADDSADGQKDITLSASPLATSVIYATVHVTSDDSATNRAIDHGASAGWTEAFDHDMGGAGTYHWGTWEGQYKTGHTSTTVRWDDIKNASQTATTYSFGGCAIEINDVGRGWELDFVDDPVGVLSGWNYFHGGFGLGVTEFTGGWKKVCTWNGGVSQNTSFSKAIYQTALATSAGQTIKGVFEFGHADSKVTLFAQSNSTFTDFIGFSVLRNGTFNGEYEGGGDGSSGSYTAPALDTPFEFELVVAAGGVYTAKINGTTISTGTFTNATTGLYGGVMLADQAKMLKYYHGDTSAPSGTAHAVTASGSGTSTGSAAIGIGGILTMSAAGTGASSGAGTLQLSLPLAAAGTGQSTGTATPVLATLPIAAEFFGAGALTANQSGTTIVPAYPASTTAGMVAVVAYMCNGACTFTTPSGWTVLGTAINSADQSTAFFVKRLTGGDANPSTTTSVTQSTTLGGYGRIYVWNYVGGTAANPLEDIGHAGTPTSTTTPQTAAVTTDGPSRTVACICVVDDDNTWSSGMPPANWTNIGTRVSSTQGGDAMMDAIQQVVAVSGTTIAATTVGTQAAADFWRTITFALVPSRLRMSADGAGQSDGSVAIELFSPGATYSMSASSGADPPFEDDFERSDGLVGGEWLVGASAGTGPVIISGVAEKGGS